MRILRRAHPWAGQRLLPGPHLDGRHTFTQGLLIPSPSLLPPCLPRSPPEALKPPAHRGSPLHEPSPPGTLFVGAFGYLTPWIGRRQGHGEGCGWWQGVRGGQHALPPAFRATEGRQHSALARLSPVPSCQVPSCAPGASLEAAPWTSRRRAAVSGSLLLRSSGSRRGFGEMEMVAGGPKSCAENFPERVHKAAPAARPALLRAGGLARGCPGSSCSPSASYGCAGAQRVPVCGGLLLPGPASPRAARRRERRRGGFCTRTSAAERKSALHKT